MGANQATGVLHDHRGGQPQTQGRDHRPRDPQGEIYRAIHAGYTEQADIRHALPAAGRPAHRAAQDREELVAARRNRQLGLFQALPHGACCDLISIAGPMIAMAKPS